MKKTTIAVPPKIITLTPEYLYKEGIKFYKKAIKIQFEQEKGFTEKTQELYAKAILYLQGAMFLGSNDACAYLSEFYKNGNPNHLGINNEQLTMQVFLVYDWELDETDLKKSSKKLE